MRVRPKRDQRRQRQLASQFGKVRGRSEATPASLLRGGLDAWLAPHSPGGKVERGLPFGISPGWRDSCIHRNSKCIELLRRIADPRERICDTSSGTRRDWRHMNAAFYGPPCRWAQHPLLTVVGESLATAILELQGSLMGVTYFLEAPAVVHELLLFGCARIGRHLGGIHVVLLVGQPGHLLSRCRSYCLPVGRQLSATHFPVIAKNGRKIRGRTIYESLPIYSAPHTSA